MGNIQLFCATIAFLRKYLNSCLLPIFPIVALHRNQRQHMTTKGPIHLLSLAEFSGFSESRYSEAKESNSAEHIRPI